MNQNTELLEYMADGKRVSGLDALQALGCFRLPARIAELKEAGVPVKSEWEYSYDEKGRVLKKWKVYWIPRGWRQ